jgi:SAM-dependent methyltransferase
LVGLDPDDNIDENSFVHRREKTVLENYKTELQFDLITMRMVAEHIRDPEKVVGALSRLAKSGGHVIIYTVSKWSPVSILASATPTIVHRIAKRALWQTEDRDTFPVIYKMNTRPALTRLFGRAGFREVTFKYLDDCRTFQRWKITNFIELTAWRILQKLNIRYPESCILAVYQKQ